MAEITKASLLGEMRVLQTQMQRLWERIVPLQNEYKRLEAEWNHLNDLWLEIDEYEHGERPDYPQVDDDEPPF
jgi:predicted  nucleic acid-binding Zn-ribbon protein